MEKFIPYEKLSKKAQKQLNSARRGTWGSISPVTRKPLNSKAYNRQKAQNWKKEFSGSAPLFYVSCQFLMVLQSIAILQVPCPVIDSFRY